MPYGGAKQNTITSFPGSSGLGSRDIDLMYNARGKKAEDFYQPVELTAEQKMVRDATRHALGASRAGEATLLRVSPINNLGYGEVVFISSPSAYTNGVFMYRYGRHPDGSVHERALNMIRREDLEVIRRSMGE